MALMKKQDKDQKGKKISLKEKDKSDKNVSKVVNYDKKNAVKEKKQTKTKKEYNNRIDSIKKYFSGVLSELKKVHWPTRSEVATYTGVVAVAVVIVGVLIWCFDLLMGMVLSRIIQ